SQKIAIELLANGHVYVFLGNRHTGHYLIEQHQLTGLKTIGDPVQVTSRAIATSHDNLELISRINSAIEILENSGELDELQDRWYGEPVSGETLWQQWRVPMAISLSVLVALLIVGYIWGDSLRRQVAKRTRHLEVLNRVITASSMKKDPYRVLEVTCRELAQGLDIPHAYALLRDPTGTELRVVAEHSRFDHDSSLLGTAVPTHDKTYILSYLKSGQVLTAVDHPEIKSLQCPLPDKGSPKDVDILVAPLITQGETAGVICLEPDVSHVLTEKERSLVSHAAVSASQSLAHARLFESERRQLQLSQTLQQVGALLTTELTLDQVFNRIFDLLANVVSYESVSIELLDSDGVLQIAAGRGHPEGAQAKNGAEIVRKQSFTERWNTDTVAVVPDTRSEPRWIDIEGWEYIHSWIGAALTVKGRMIGVLNLDHTLPGAYNQELGERILVFANQAAVAIENARLYDASQRELTARQQAEGALERRTRELSLLYQGGRQLSESLNVDQLYRSLTGLVAGFSPLDALLVGNLSEDRRTLSWTYVWHLGSSLPVTDLPTIALNEEEDNLLTRVLFLDEMHVISSQDPMWMPLERIHQRLLQRGKTTSRLLQATKQAKSAVLVPIPEEGVTEGILIILANESEAFSRSDVRIIGGLARQLGANLANTQHFRRAQDEIAERLRTEKLAQERRAYVERILASVPDAIVTLDTNQLIAEWNPGAERLYGYSRDDAIGKNLDDLITSPDVESQARQLTELLFDGEPVTRTECVRYRKDKTPVHVIHAASPIFVDNEITGVVAAYTDISDQIRAEEEATRRANYQGALNAIIARASAATEPDPVLQLALEHTLQALGLVRGMISVGELTHSQNIDDSQLEPLQRLANSVVSTSVPIQVPGPNADRLSPDFTDLTGLEPIQSILGHPITIQNEVRGVFLVADDDHHPWIEEEQSLVAAVCQNLSSLLDKLDLLQQVRDQVKEIQRIVDTVPYGLILLDSDRNVVLANPAAEEILDKDLGIKIGDPIDNLGTIPIADFLALPDAPPVTSHEVRIPGERATLLQVSVRKIASPGPEMGWVMSLRDITTERRKQEHAHKQDRLASLGQLASGIAHDFNNIMAIIVLYTQMMKRDSEIKEEHHEKLETMLEQSRRASDLIQQILDFSRRSVLKRRAIDLKSFLDDTCGLLDRTFPESIHLHFTVENDQDYVINADESRMQQVIMNLAFNARDAMPDGGHLWYQLDRVSIDTKGNAPAPEITPGEWIRIRVSDSGGGISQENLGRVFEPFFTTRSPEGAGLGLSQVFGIISQHGGHIDVQSPSAVTLPEHDGDPPGTTFTIMLPHYDKECADKDDHALDQIHRGTGQTILVVEDNTKTRSALVDSLVELNYQPIEAENGLEALAKLRSYKGEIDLVLSDLIMPEMGGAELFEMLQVEFPKVQLLAITGHPLEDPAVEPVTKIAQVMQKPVPLEQLAQVLHSCFHD
ncbi:MAG: GAF domain-containing protein, partial [Chloroflexota bacterium]